MTGGDSRLVTRYDIIPGECLRHGFMKRPVHPSFGWVKTNMDGYKYGWTGTKMKEQKRSSKPIDIVSYALKVSVNGVMCDCSPFQVIRHI